MIEVQNKNLQKYLPPTLFLVAAHWAGSKRLIHYFPQATSNGLFYPAILGSGVTLGSWMTSSKDNKRRIELTLLGLGSVFIITPFLPKILKGKEDLNHIASMRFVVLQGTLFGMVEVACFKPGSQPQLPHDEPLPCKESLPTSFYEFSEEEELTLTYWRKNTLDENGLPSSDTPPYNIQKAPVAASPGHGKSPFAAAGSQRQYIVLQLKKDNLVVPMTFQASHEVMKPNIDTMLLCSGIHKLFQEGITFSSAVDIGSGSGFIAKFLAETDPSLQVTAMDISNTAIHFMQSAITNENVTISKEDATQIDSLDSFDLVVSNPPYVPTEKETSVLDPHTVNPNFWEGTRLMCHMLEKAEATLSENGHLVLLVSSIALKSLALQDFLNNKVRRLKPKILYQSEVAYKAWYAGNNKVNHILANEQEVAQPTYFKNLNLDLYVGATRPGHPRDCKADDGRKEHTGYYWQMIYIVDFSVKTMPGTHS